MKEFDTARHQYLFGALDSPRSLRILDFLLKKTDNSAKYLEIKQRTRQFLDAPAISVPELMRAGLIECFDGEGNKIPIVASYLPEKNVCEPEITVKVSKFAQDLIKFLDENSTSLGLCS